MGGKRETKSRRKRHEQENESEYYKGQKEMEPSCKETHRRHISDERENSRREVEVIE